MQNVVSGFSRTWAPPVSIPGLAIAVVWLLWPTGGRPSVSASGVEPATSVVWVLESVERVGGHVATVVGTPRVVMTEIGPGVEFDGRGDGLFLDVNPVEGLDAFTIEVLFQPSADGAAEQRFVHVQETGTENRALVELRMLPGARWSLDTFLRSDASSLTLIDRAMTHPAGQWHVAALTYDGRTMVHYVNAVRELSGDLPMRALRAGRTSIGVRQNRVSWFKGRIRLVRISSEALPPSRLLVRPTP